MPAGTDYVSSVRVCVCVWVWCGAPPGVRCSVGFVCFVAVIACLGSGVGPVCSFFSGWAAPAAPGARGPPLAELS